MSTKSRQVYCKKINVLMNADQYHALGFNLSLNHYISEVCKGTRYVCPSGLDGTLDHSKCQPLHSPSRIINETYPWLVTQDGTRCCLNVKSENNNTIKQEKIGINRKFSCPNSNGEGERHGHKGSWQAWYLPNFNITSVTPVNRLKPALRGVQVNCPISFESS